MADRYPDFEKGRSAHPRHLHRRCQRPEEITNQLQERRHPIPNRLEFQKGHLQKVHRSRRLRE